MIDIKIIKSSMLQKFQLSSSYEVIVALPAIDMELAKKTIEIMKCRIHTHTQRNTVVVN